MEVIDLCESSDESTSSSSNAGKNGRGNNGLRSNGPQSDGSITSISSTEKSVEKSAKKSSADIKVNADNDNDKLPKLSQKRRRRSAGGYRLEEGERFAWASEIETGEPHQSIILHPQPDPPPGSVGMVYIEWLNGINKNPVWIPRSNISSQICGENGAIGRRRQFSARNGVTNGHGLGKKRETNGHGLSKRKRVATKRYITETSKLAREKERKQEMKKQTAKKGRSTCCTDVECVAKLCRPAKKLPHNVSSLIAHDARMLDSAKMISENKFDGSWRQKGQLRKKPTAVKKEENGAKKEEKGAKEELKKPATVDESRGGLSVGIIECKDQPSMSLFPVTTSTLNCICWCSFLRCLLHLSRMKITRAFHLS